MNIAITALPVGWTDVASSNLAALRYDGGSAQGTLYVRFRSGAVYAYQGVPERIVADVLSAPSHGRAFNTLVRSGPFPYERIA